MHRRVSKRQNVLARLLAGLFVGANVVTVLLLWACVLSTYVNPADFPLLSLLGLAFPVFLIANVAFFVFWLVFKVRAACISLVGVLAVIGFVRDYCPVSLKEEMPDSTLCILSYNVGYMQGDEYVALDSIIRALRPDIACMQEITVNATVARMLGVWQDSLGYDMRKDASRMILSRHPFVGEDIFTSGPSRGGNGTLMCRVTVGGDTILVANSHLESNSLTKEDRQEYRRMIVEHQKEQISHGGRQIAHKLCAAARYRGRQTDSLACIIDRHAGESMVFCGDFNDTPVSYTFQTISRRLSPAFTERGRGVGFSYNRGLFYVRIDHLFHTPGWACVKCYVDNTIDASDHYPLVTYLCKKHP